MSAAQFAEIEGTLLLIAEARERAERTAKKFRREDAEARLVQALAEADRALLAVHGDLMRSAYFETSSGPSEAASEQLRLAASG